MTELVEFVNVPESINGSGNIVEEWIKYLEKRKKRKPKTVETYKKGLKMFFVYLRENNIINPNWENVADFFEKLKAEEKTPSTQQTYKAAIRSFFKFAELTGFYSNIALDIETDTPSRKHKKDPLSKSQVRELLGSIGTESEADLRDRAMLITMFTTGIRTISIASADIRDIRSLSDGTPALYYLGKRKDDKSEFVKLCPAADRAIRAYLKVRNPGSDTEPLFKATSNRSKTGRMRTESISRIFKTRCRAIGIDSERISAHSCRHTMSTQALLNGADIKEVQQVLDHQNIQTTQIYDHALQRASNDTEMIVGHALFEE